VTWKQQKNKDWHIYIQPPDGTPLRTTGSCPFASASEVGPSDKQNKSEKDDQDKPQLSGRTRGMWTVSFFPHPFISRFSHSLTFLSAIRARKKSANDGHSFVELRGFS
jgi:hypothetical protein